MPAVHFVPFPHAWGFDSGQVEVRRPSCLTKLAAAVEPDTVTSAWTAELAIRKFAARKSKKSSFCFDSNAAIRVILSLG